MIEAAPSNEGHKTSSCVQTGPKATNQRRRNNKIRLQDQISSKSFRFFFFSLDRIFIRHPNITKQRRYNKVVPAYTDWIG